MIDEAEILEIRRQRRQWKQVRKAIRIMWIVWGICLAFLFLHSGCKSNPKEKPKMQYSNE